MPNSYYNDQVSMNPFDQPSKSDYLGKQKRTSSGDIGLAKANNSKDIGLSGKSSGDIGTSGKKSGYDPNNAS